MTDSSVDTSAAARRAEDVARLLGIIRSVLGKADLGVDDDIMDHGGTSLSLVRILAEGSSALGRDIDPHALGDSATARSLVAAAG